MEKLAQFMHVSTEKQKAEGGVLKGNEPAKPVSPSGIIHEFSPGYGQLLLFELCVGVEQGKTETMVGTPEDEIKSITVPETASHKSEKYTDA